MNAPQRDIRGVLITVNQGRMLLPNASVAEVITFSEWGRRVSKTQGFNVYLKAQTDDGILVDTLRSELLRELQHLDGARAELPQARPSISAA